MRYLDSQLDWTVPELWTPPEDIADASWADIEKLSALAAADRASYLKYVGQSIEIDFTDKSGMGNTKKVKALIWDIGQDERVDGEPVGFNFILLDGLDYTGWQMNSSATFPGGYPACAMKTKLQSTMYPAFPDEIRTRLKQMRYKCSTAFTGSTVVNDDAYLYLAAPVNIFGLDKANYSISPAQDFYQYEGQWGEYWKNHNTNTDRIVKDCNGSAHAWWLRSRGESDPYVALVRNVGTFRTDGASYKYMPCACFSV